MSSAFPKRRFGRLLASFRERYFPRACYRGCSYFFMFRPHSLLASQIAPTAASEPAGQPRLVHPSRTCVVTFARIGYAIRPTTGNWRNEDFHLARFAACRLLTPLPSFSERDSRGSRAPTGLPAPPLPARSVGGRDRHDHGTRRTSALPVVDTRPEGYPAWQRVRYPSELCGPVVWRSRPEWIARHRTSGV